MKNSGDGPMNRKKNDDKGPPRGRMRRRGNKRVSVNGSVWGTTDDTSPRAIPRKTERRRRKSMNQHSAEINDVTTLMRFVTNNCSERVTLLEIAMKPSEVCYRSHNSLSHKLVVT